MLELLFDQEYNELPPDVWFVTVPFHPNSMLRECVARFLSVLS